MAYSVMIAMKDRKDRSETLFVFTERKKEESEEEQIRKKECQTHICQELIYNGLFSFEEKGEERRKTIPLGPLSPQRKTC